MKSDIKVSRKMKYVDEQFVHPNENLKKLIQEIEFIPLNDEDFKHFLTDSGVPNLGWESEDRFNEDNECEAKAKKVRLTLTLIVDVENI